MTARKTRALLALVVLMGILIIVGLVVVVATVSKRMTSAMPSGVATTSLAAFGSADLPIPAGCEVVETVTSADRLILRLGRGDRCNEMLVVDLATGRLLGRLNLVPATQ